MKNLNETSVHACVRACLAAASVHRLDNLEFSRVDRVDVRQSSIAGGHEAVACATCETRQAHE